MESKSKGEAAHLDASAKIGRGRGGDDGSDDGAALRADGGWRSAAAAAPGLARAARPRGAAPPGAPSAWTAAWDGRGAWRLEHAGRLDADAAAQPKDAGGGTAPAARPRPREPDVGRHRDMAWRVLRGDAARADGSTSDSGSDGACAVPVPAPDSLPGEDAPARRRRRRGSSAKQGDDSDSDGRPRRPRRRRVAERKR
jgi:hypothetical protein